MNRHYVGAFILAMLAMLVCAGPMLAQGIDTLDPSLPPNDGVYRTPDQVHAEFTGGALQIILKNPEHSRFTNVIRETIGPNEKETFDSELHADVQVIIGGIDQGTAPVMATGQVMTMVFGKTGNTTGTFQTEMLSMSLTGNSPLGPFMIRESPMLPSLGQTTITGPSGGPYHIDSFFDVFTELSLDGGGSWMPDTQGPAHMELQPTIPEPASVALLAFGLVGIAGLARRRR